MLVDGVLSHCIIFERTVRPSARLLQSPSVCMYVCLYVYMLSFWGGG